MNAAALSPDPAPPAPAAPLHAAASQPVGSDADNEFHAAEAAAEHRVLHDAVVGAIVGAVACAPIWSLLVLLALRNAGTALWPPVAMAAGIGLIAGAFLGGWAGTLIGSTAMERFEQRTRPRAPHSAS